MCLQFDVYVNWQYMTPKMHPGRGFSLPDSTAAAITQVLMATDSMQGQVRTILNHLDSLFCCSHNLS